MNELALDARWTWSHAADALWHAVDESLWQRTESPWLVLQRASQQRLVRLAADATFLELLRVAVQEREAYLLAPGWYGEVHTDAGLSGIAYFSLEFGLGEGLPLYAGGLGILAGDHLKAASDLGVPLVGMGLLYQRGYLRQMLDASGAQQAFFPYNDTTGLPIAPTTDPAGDWLQVEIALPGRSLRIRIWEARIGCVTLYLLDTNDPLNSAVDRGIAAELYGGGPETRLLQEIVLGIGGWRALHALGIESEICHMNEGHAAFVALERCRLFARERGLDFEEALWATRAGNLFTTHTPVPAGFDRFEPVLFGQYFASYAQELGVPLSRLLGLGRCEPRAVEEPFNMAYLALRCCARVNGVSKLHGRVSRELFASLFPRWPLAEVPVQSVTNGVHVPSWDSAAADALWTEACGKKRWLGAVDALEERIEALSDAALWRFRTEGRRRMVEAVRPRLLEQLQLRGAEHGELEVAQHALDPDALTLGFARRFTEYKRPTLLLWDPERLRRLLCNPTCPVQLLVAGKAHPRDVQGQEMIRAWTAFARRPELRSRVVFLADYDMALAQLLAQGVDVWINTPRRPYEACGTSGMKVLANGGLNLSELDGWWAEAFSPEVGWALGDGQEHREPDWDAREAADLIQILEEEVVPAFYRRDARGVPRGWTRRMRNSMARLAPYFSTNRMLRQYVELLYLPAAADQRRRATDGARRARALAQWQRRIQRHWDGVRFLDLSLHSDEQGHHARVQVCLSELAPEEVAVELYAEGSAGREPLCALMKHASSLEGSVHGHVFETTVPDDRPAASYTPRLRPAHPLARLPQEESRILWYR